ncbi:Mitochondrial 50S ribosomal L50-like protein [Euroglyphus maynei]|uniref:Large ribosomal subunit protein mL50 n=1 Tax=Euroglyphus maynei TaxID=6958 RepID=A0A1Y3BE71_EURMA|nr:Mitochondrial 50S ribosomal L50-like protein [Euroglyphus maynei]
MFIVNLTKSSSSPAIKSLLNQSIRPLAHYVINQNGEKVVVSKRTSIRTKREKWQNVKPMEYDDELRKIRKIELNKRLHTDPEQARQMAEDKFQQLADYLHSSGLCRDTKPYEPPENVSQIIDEICREVSKGSKVFSNLNEKFNNSELYRMNTVDDVKEYYMTPVRGLSKYNVWAYEKSTLPPNLNIIPEPIRFNPKTDTFFDGVNAFPGQTPQVIGLRAKKKYPQMEDNFIWPDV